MFSLLFNMEIIKRLQTVVAPETFTPRVVYDGRKNIFAPRQLALGPTDSQEVCDPSISICWSPCTDIPCVVQLRVDRASIPSKFSIGGSISFKSSAERSISFKFSARRNISFNFSTGRSISSKSSTRRS